MLQNDGMPDLVIPLPHRSNRHVWHFTAEHQAHCCLGSGQPQLLDLDAICTCSSVSCATGTGSDPGRGANALCLQGRDEAVSPSTKASRIRLFCFAWTPFRPSDEASVMLLWFAGGITIAALSRRGCASRGEDTVFQMRRACLLQCLGAIKKHINLRPLFRCCVAGCVVARGIAEVIVTLMVTRVMSSL